jgi:hypothetical protein
MLRQLLADLQRHRAQQRRPEAEPGHRVARLMQPQRRQRRRRPQRGRGRGQDGQHRQMPLDQPGVEPRLGEVRMPRQPGEEGEIGDRARHPRLLERPHQPPQRRRPVRPVHDQLGDHRVVMRRDRVARPDAGLGPHALGKVEMRQPPDRRQESLRRVLGIEPRLEGVAAQPQFLLPLRQRLARGHPQLPFHQILAGHRLGHRMLDLQTGVHLHEPEPVGAQPARAVDDELDRARPA